MGDCTLCAGACAGADLSQLLTPSLAWLWEQFAAAGDRRGDAQLTHGTLNVKAPASVDERAAATGLLGGRVLVAGQSRRVDLAHLTGRLQIRGPRLTPGAVAAHATGRALAAKHHARAARERLEDQLRMVLHDGLEGWFASRGVDTDQVWAGLRRSGWVGRLVAFTDPVRDLGAATAVVAALPEPGERVDRRTLADTVLDDPHGLDDGARVPGLVLALLSAAGFVPARLRSRQAWDRVGVDYDDLTGGLLTLGIHPAGWVLPPQAVVTLPPRELARCVWPGPPPGGGRVFVTENPSVLAAAAARVEQTGALVHRLLCTVGTPSAVEVAAVGRLAEAGWRVAVRADFDIAGLGHVTALLGSHPDVVAWRMDAATYEHTLRRSPNAPALARRSVPDTSWDPDLAVAMRRRCRAGYEEALLDDLVADVCESGRWTTLSSQAAPRA